MRYFSLVLALLALITLVAAAPPVTSYDANASLVRRGGCSQGVHVCCGSTSVSCSGNVCKACCGNQCGCFYTRGSTCSSDPNVVPCVDTSKPDFAVVNGQCNAPNSGSGGLLGGGGNTGGSTGGNTGGNTGSTKKPAYCARLPARYKSIFGC